MQCRQFELRSLLPKGSSDIFIYTINKNGDITFLFIIVRSDASNKIFKLKCQRASTVLCLAAKTKMDRVLLLIWFQHTT